MPTAAFSEAAHLEASPVFQLPSLNRSRPDSLCPNTWMEATGTPAPAAASGLILPSYLDFKFLPPPLGGQQAPSSSGTPGTPSPPSTPSPDPDLAGQPSLDAAPVTQSQDELATQSLEHIGEKPWIQTTCGTAYQLKPATGEEPLPGDGISAGMKRKRKRHMWFLPDAWPEEDWSREEVQLKHWQEVLPIGQTLSCAGMASADRPMYFRLYLGRQGLCDISVRKIGALNAWNIAMRICQAVLDKEILPTRGNFATLKEKYLDEKASELLGGLIQSAMPMSAPSSST